MIIRGYFRGSEERYFATAADVALFMFIVLLSKLLIFRCGNDHENVFM